MPNTNGPIVSPRPPLAPLKINPIRSRLSKNAAKEMNNYGEIWEVNLNKMGNIPVGNAPSYSNKEMEQKRRNNRLEWARKPRTYGGMRRKQHRRATRKNTRRNGKK